MMMTVMMMMMMMTIIKVSGTAIAVAILFTPSSPGPVGPVEAVLLIVNILYKKRGGGGKKTCAGTQPSIAL